MDVSFILFGVLAFLAVVLALEGFYNLWASSRSAEARRIATRLAALRGEVRSEVSLERLQERGRTAWFQKLLDRSRDGQRLSKWVSSSGLSTTPGQVMLLSLGLAALGIVTHVLFAWPALICATLGLALAVLPWWRVAAARARQVERFERQFPEALDLMARAMRAGHAFPSAIQMVGDEMSDPLGRDFRLLFDEINYGAPTHEALARLAERVPLPDVSYFVVAVLIQRESGGNLAELLDKISAIVRARLKLLGEVRTLSAEGRLSAWILTGLPFCVALAVNLVNPEFMAVLWTDPAGLRMVGVALFLMGMGILWMRNVIRIRV